MLTSHTPLEDLEEKLSGGSPLIQQWAFRQLARHHSSHLEGIIPEILVRRKSPLLRQAALLAGRRQITDAAFPLFSLLKESKGSLRAECATALGAMNYQPALKYLLEIFSDNTSGDWLSLIGAAEALASFRHSNVREAFLSHFETQEWQQYPRSLVMALVLGLLAQESAQPRSRSVQALIAVTAEWPEDLQDWWFPVLYRLGNAGYLSELPFLHEIQHPSPLAEILELGGFRVGPDERKIFQWWESLLLEEEHVALWRALRQPPSLVSEDMWKSPAGRLYTHLVEDHSPQVEASGVCQEMCQVTLALLLSLMEEEQIPETVNAGKLIRFLKRDLFLSHCRESHLVSQLTIFYPRSECIQQGTLKRLREPCGDAPQVRSIRTLAQADPEALFSLLPCLLSSPDTSGIVLGVLLEVAAEHPEKTLRAMTTLSREFPSSLLEDILIIAHGAESQTAAEFLTKHLDVLVRKAPAHILDLAVHHGTSAFLGPVQAVAKSVPKLQAAAEETLAALKEIDGAPPGPRSGYSSHEQADSLEVVLLGLETVSEDSIETTIRCVSCFHEFPHLATEILVDPDDTSFLLGEEVECPQCGTVDCHPFTRSSIGKLSIHWARQLVSPRDSRSPLRLLTVTVGGDKMGPQAARAKLQRRQDETPSPRNLMLLGKMYVLLRRRNKAAAYLRQVVEQDHSQAEAEYLLGCIARDRGDVKEMLFRFGRVRSLQNEGRAQWHEANYRPIMQEVNLALKKVRQLSRA